MGQAFDLAEGTVLFKGDFTQFDEDLKAGEAKLKTLNNALKDGSFKMQLYAAKSFNDELAKANRQAKKLMDEVKFGKWGALFKDFDFSKAASKFSSGAAKVGAAAAGVGGGALALGAGGSPLAQNTLSGSFELLKTEVGGIFTPLVKDVSRGLQEMRNTFRGLSEETKSMINEGAKFIGIAGLTALALATVAKGLSLIANHPFIAMITAGISVGSAFNSWWSGRTSKTIDELQTRNMTFDSKKVLKDNRSEEIASLSPEKRGQAAADDMKREWNRFEAARQEYEEYRTGFSGGNIKGGLKRLIDPFGNDEMKLIDAATTAQASFEKAKIRYNEFAGKLPQRKDAKDNMLLGAFGPTTMVGGVAEMFKNFQLGAAGGNTLEAEIKKTQLENQNKLLSNSEQQTQYLKKISENAPIAR